MLLSLILRSAIFIAVSFPLSALLRKSIRVWRRDFCLRVILRSRAAARHMENTMT